MKQFVVLFIDGQYKDIVVVKAKSQEEAEQILLGNGWKDWIEIKQMNFSKSGICFAINSLE